MRCHTRAIFCLLVTLLLVEDVFPMEDYIGMDFDTSDLPFPDSSSEEPVPSTSFPVPSSVVPSSTADSSTISVPITPTPMPSPVPSPVPPPDKPYLEYHNISLYFFIHNLKMDFKHMNEDSYSVYGSELNAMDSKMTVMPTDEQLIISYFNDEMKNFEFTFNFERGPSETNDEEEWRLDSFQHQNFSEPSTPLYNYTGPGFSINSRLGRGFNCSSIEFLGTAHVGDGTIFSRTRFTNLSVQPYLKNGKVSSDFYSCNSAAVRDEGLPIEVIIGLTICGCVVVAAVIVTILAIAIKKYRKKRQYDLLSD